jgi:hypothetical protein
VKPRGDHEGATSPTAEIHAQSPGRGASYFNEQYFTKIDKDVRSYYSLEIDLSEQATID